MNGSNVLGIDCSFLTNRKKRLRRESVAHENHYLLSYCHRFVQQNWYVDVIKYKF
jgi:hypothetical protein